MAITDRTRKILWAKSGNRCALCKKELIIDASDNDDESVVADECHIRSAKPDGPRHEPPYPKAKLDTVENLLLLCRVHHKMVDDQVNSYTVERLTQLKVAHEAWVSETLDSVDRPGPPRQISSPPGDFVGREDDIREILENINDRGVTISGVRGMAGIGKTALAYVIAERLKAGFDAHFYLDLKGSEAKPLTPAEAQAHVLVGYQPEAKLPDEPAQLAGLYRSLLSKRPALLMMDNALDAAQVEPLIPPAGCVMLVTSRQRFGLPGWFAMDLNTLPEDKARELLTSIAPRVAPTEDAEQESLDRIVALCCFLPLAVRLAGGVLARRPDISLEAYVARFEDERGRLDQLDEVRAAVRASEALLDEAARRLWRLLAVFPGYFDLPASAAVWELDEPVADKAIGTLLEYSLLTWSAETQRYRLHDLVRLAARERLGADAADRHGAELRFVAHYKNVLAGANNMYQAGGKQMLAGLALYDAETDNIAAAFDWCAARSPEDDEAARLCSALLDVGVYCFALREHPRRRIARHEVALVAARRLNDRGAEGRHLGNLGVAYGDLGVPRRAIELHENALEIVREIGDWHGEARTLGNLGNAYAKLGEPRRAIEFHEQHLEIAREISDQRDEGVALSNLGSVYADLGEPRRAIKFYEQHLQIARDIEDQWAEGAGLGNLGITYKNLGEFRRAIECHEQGLDIARVIGDRRGEALALGNLGTVYFELGEPRRAIEFFEQDLQIARDIGDQWDEGAALGSLGNAYKDLPEPRRAIKFYEQHVEIAREIGDRRGEGRTLNNLGLAYSDLGEPHRAIDFYQKSLGIARETEDRYCEGLALGNLGIAYTLIGEPRRAIEFYEQDLEIARRTSNRLGEGQVLNNLGLAYADLGEHRHAIEFYEHSLEVVREIGDRGGEGRTLNSLGLAYAGLGEGRHAIELYERALDIMREVPDRRSEGYTLDNLGVAYAALGERRRAIELHERVLDIMREISDRRGAAFASWNLGEELAKEGKTAQAVARMQVGVDYFREIGHPDADKHAAQVVALRRQLDSE